MITEKQINKLRGNHIKQLKRWEKEPGYEEAYNEVDVEYRLAYELQKKRKQQHLSQKDVAERMHTTQSVVSRIERGSNISVETLARYAKACGAKLEIKLAML